MNEIELIALAFACGTVIGAMWGYLVGRKDGKDATMDLYIHEQNCRVAAEDERDSVKKYMVRLENELIALRKEFGGL